MAHQYGRSSHLIIRKPLIVLVCFGFLVGACGGPIVIPPIDDSGQEDSSVSPPPDSATPPADISDSAEPVDESSEETAQQDLTQDLGSPDTPVDVIEQDVSQDPGPSEDAPPCVPMSPFPSLDSPLQIDGPANGGVHTPNMMCTQSDLALIYRDAFDDKLRFARVTPDGSFVVSPKVIAAELDGSVHSVRAGTDYFVAGSKTVSDESYAYLYRLDAQGELVTPETPLGYTSSNQGILVQKIMTHSNKLSLVVRDEDGQTSYLTRLDFDGGPAAFASPMELTLGALELYPSENVTSVATNFTDLAWSGSEYGVVFSISFLDPNGPGTDSYFGIMNSSGGVSAVTQLPSAADEKTERPQVKWNGSHFVVVYGVRPPSGGFEVYAALYDEAGAAYGAPKMVSDGTTTSVFPGFTLADDQIGVVWQQQGAGPHYFRSLDLNGEPDNDPGIVVAADILDAGDFLPSIAWCMNRYIVAWRSYSDIGYRSHLQFSNPVSCP